MQLLSFLIALTPTEPTTVAGFYGREAQAWLLAQVSRHDQQMAERLHIGSKQRPYTVSSLIIPGAGRRTENGETRLIPGNDCLLRFTSIDSDLSDLIKTRVMQNLPAILQLKWSEFKILGIAEESCWQGETTFAELIRRAGIGKRALSVTLDFASPTSFRSGRVDLTLPTPEHVWRSLFWRWNSFAPPDLQIDSIWPEFVTNCVVVSEYHIWSMKVCYNHGVKGSAVGCTGQTTYRMLGEKHCGEYAAFRKGAGQILRTLAGFALYSGIGHHTATGLGQTRWIMER